MASLVLKIVDWLLSRLEYLTSLLEQWGLRGWAINWIVSGALGLSAFLTGSAIPWAITCGLLALAALSVVRTSRSFGGSDDLQPFAARSVERASKSHMNEVATRSPISSSNYFRDMRNMYYMHFKPSYELLLTAAFGSETRAPVPFLNSWIRNTSVIETGADVETVNAALANLIDMYFLLMEQNRDKLDQAAMWKQRHIRWLEEMRRLFTYAELGPHYFSFGNYFSATSLFGVD